jgi:hypothetical protein
MNGKYATEVSKTAKAKEISPWQRLLIHSQRVEAILVYLNKLAFLLPQC